MAEDAVRGAGLAYHRKGPQFPSLAKQTRVPTRSAVFRGTPVPGEVHMDMWRPEGPSGHLSLLLFTFLFSKIGFLTESHAF